MKRKIIINENKGILFWITGLSGCGKTSIAKKIKTSPRAVGNACGANKCLLIIPCHRIISKSKKNGGFSSFGGMVHKDLLLSLEK